MFIQGLETLSLRGERHCKNTQAVAEWLEADERVNWVLYPGLPSHPDYEHTRKTMPNGAGGVLTFGLVCASKAMVTWWQLILTGNAQAGTIDEVRAFVDNLKLCSHLANVGDAKTLVIHPWVRTYILPATHARTNDTPGDNPPTAARRRESEGRCHARLDPTQHWSGRYRGHVSRSQYQHDHLKRPVLTS